MPEHAFFDVNFPLFNLIIMIDVLEVVQFVNKHSIFFFLNKPVYSV